MMTYFGDRDIEEKDKRQAAQYSPLVLAYIGDGVYEMYIRLMLVEKGNMPVNKLHRQATVYVKANAQSTMVQQLYEQLTEKERQIYKRGRNAKSGTSPKNADIQDYRRATGFEALLGYLYLVGETARIEKLMALGVDSLASRQARSEYKNSE